MTTARSRTAVEAGALLFAALLAALAVTSLGLAGSSAAAPSGALVAGCLGVAGAVILLRAWSGARTTFRTLLAAGVLVSAVGQLLKGAAMLAGATTYPSAGDVVMVLSGPVVVVGIVLAPRRAHEPLAASRLLCEAVISGSAAAATLWRLGLDDVVDPATAGGAAVVAILLVELSVLALFAVAALRTDSGGLGLVAAGAALYVSADLVTQLVSLPGSPAPPWPATALTCFAWPLAVVGMIRIRFRTAPMADRDRPAAEQRRSLGAAAVNAALLAAFLTTVVHDPSLDRTSVLLPGVCVVAVAVRELVLVRQNAALVGRLAELAYRDELTGLANRRALLERLHTDEGAGQVWLLTVDLDNFKQVNGLLGHGSGDELLARAATALAAACGPEDEAFRLGGDEFAVVARGALSHAEQLAGEIGDDVRRAALRVPGVGRVALSASVGIAALPGTRRREPLRSLAESAAAMQTAKAEGRSRSVVYAGAVAAAAERRRLVEVRLREALFDGALRVHAQPLVSLADGRITGLEMLARWDDALLGVVSPDEFVAIAEASSLITTLGDTVMECSLRAAAEHDLDGRDVAMGVNVSVAQLRQPGYADHLLQRLAAHGVPPHRLVVEVTESAFVDDGDPALPELHLLAAAGVVLAVDDFGVGAASLAYLRRMPTRILKLDRSLVASMLTDARSASIVRSMARMGVETGLDVVAEGIEDEATAQACRDAGVPYGQGWLWSADVPLRELDDAIARLGGRPRPTSTSTPTAHRLSGAAG